MTKWRRFTGGIWRRVPVVAVLAASLSGCGYHVAGHSSELPKTIHVIAVPAMENKTTSYRIEQKLTAATIHDSWLRRSTKWSRTRTVEMPF